MVNNNKAPQGSPKPFDPPTSREGSSWWGVRLAILRVLIVLAVFFSLRYYAWRLFNTQNPAAMWFFYTFLIAEIMNSTEAWLFYFTTWKTVHHSTLPALEGRTVDFFIPTYNEPVEILRETLVCALSVRYPHKTYLLDDGNRPEVRALAAEFECGYITRTERSHAKAGNLNNALKYSDGEFIVVLDADHVPAPEFVDSIIGFFADERVGIVQAPQDFYNLDSFMHLTDWRHQYAWQQQELFYSVVQPGKDGWGATMYCGSPAMIRRKALDDIGGFALETITEDMHTGLRLQKRGWKVLFYNHTIARGLAPQTFTAFATQWHRWGVGSMQVFREENPLFCKGLTAGQRINYFCAFFFYFLGYQKLVFVLTPIFCLLTGLLPLNADPRVFLGYFGWHFVLNMFALGALQGGLRSFLLAEEYNLIKMHILMKSLIGLLRGEQQFKVTPKSKHGAALWTEVWPQMAILTIGALSLMVGWYRLINAQTEFQLWGWLVNLFWAMFFLLLTARVVMRSLRRKELRMSYRFPSRLDVPVTLDYELDGSRKSVKLFARNLNRFGFSVTTDEPLAAGTELEIGMTVMERNFRATGRVMRNFPITVQKKALFANGIKFETIDAADQDQISKYLFWEIAPRHGDIMKLTKLTQTQEPNA
ncbi:MAG TPA: glycosyltransferase [Candidatus Acidoferrales bacterium]|nr:glycosyltransferase [Candidatus Acidoferrales bacterium]